MFRVMNWNFTPDDSIKGLYWISTWSRGRSLKGSVLDVDRGILVIVVPFSSRVGFGI